ncbi:LysR family transcriptional regulator [Vibrio sp. SCSIO 43135]|uniref:LysR family transcriptional regulator n=1 Tax=Vibrio sp. SCSIO 43135 TaxID=2819096 RepID=UPI002074B18B|nr:LysR family transcriptional regulator [Vibrio sp. SCSIO 43135]USD42857.1 LysR family transcriptional regulator [Vibrio sp. SCSIO 43135]
MLENLDLNLLKVFVTVYRHRSITLAAEEMGMTQPGVSGLLKRLQQQVGCPLFVRSGRGIAPTHHAQELVRHVEPALIQINNALESLEGFNTSQARKFVVYASEPVMLMLLPMIEADDTLGNVSIELQPTHSNEEKLIDDLTQNQADLAIEFSNHSTVSFFTEELFEDSVCVIARKDHPRLSGSITQAEFYQEKHVTLKLRREDAYLADYFTEERLPQRIVAAECTSLLSQMSMIATTDCIATMTGSMANLFADKLGIQVFPHPYTVIPVKHRLLVHNREKNSPSNKWLRSKLKSYFTAV